MATKADGRNTVPFEVVHDIYEVLHRYPAGTPLRERLQRYRRGLERLGRAAAEINARLAKAQPVIEVALRHVEARKGLNGWKRARKSAT